MHLPSTLRIEGRNFLGELAEGWREFVSRTWLWTIVLQFGFVNAVVSGTELVLGPVIAKEHLGGATAWGLILTAGSVGLIFGGLLALRFRPRRILLTATLGYLLSIPILLGLAVPLPLGALIVLGFVAGIGNETFGVLWDTAIQQEIPQEKLSRVSSYDALGSFALIPLGLAAAGPIADLIGTERRSSARPRSASSPLWPFCSYATCARCRGVSCLWMRARRSTAAVFLVHAAIAGTLAPRIPAIKSGLGLGDGQLGIALTGFAAGLFAGTRIAAWLVDRYGSRRVVQVGLPLLAVGLAGPALAGGLATLTLALVPFGIAAGLVDVAMNAQAVQVERAARRPIMSSLHGFWSVGLLASSGIASGLAAAGVSVRTNLLVAAAILTVLSLLVPRGLVRDVRSERARDSRRGRGRSRGRRARDHRFLLVPRRGRGGGLERRVPPRGRRLERSPGRPRVHGVRRWNGALPLLGRPALCALRAGRDRADGWDRRRAGTGCRAGNRGGPGGPRRVRAARPGAGPDRPDRLQRRGQPLRRLVGARLGRDDELRRHGARPCRHRSRWPTVSAYAPA